jgi:transcriptional regulator with XRE-family HTH domain
MKVEDSKPNVPARRLAELLRRLDEQGMRQAEVARRANVPPQYLSDVKTERREMSELFARRLGEEFGCNYQWLLGEDDGPERVVLTPPISKAKVWLPMIGEAIAGDPREHPRWSGAYVEVCGMAAAKAAQAEQPYVLQLGHDDREGRLKKGDLVLVSQTIAESHELNVVRSGKTILLARKKGAKWLRVAAGKPLRGHCDVTGHCLGMVWAALE